VIGEMFRYEISPYVSEYCEGTRSHDRRKGVRREPYIHIINEYIPATVLGRSQGPRKLRSIFVPILAKEAKSLEDRGTQWTGAESRGSGHQYVRVPLPTSLGGNGGR
jgi:hypothetical protein